MAHRIFRAAALASLLLYVPTLWGQQLCPVTKAKSDDEAPEVQMKEADFQPRKGLEAIAWLRDGVSEAIEKSSSTEDLRSTQFEFPLHNNTTIAKGALLRQQALLEREKLEVARLKVQAGTATKVDVDSAAKRFARARQDFCKFLAEAGWAE